MPHPIPPSCAWLLALVALALASPGVAGEAPAAPDARTVLDDCSKPWTFAYLEWKDTVRNQNGCLVLAGVKCTGGVGMKQARDLTPYADSSPVLRVKVGAGNTAKGIAFSLFDADGRRGRFNFTLPAASDAFVEITPQGAVPLASPNSTEDAQKEPSQTPLDLARITQYQLSGDWSKNVLDIEVDAIVLAAPDAQLSAERSAYARERAEAAATAARQAAEEQERQAKRRQDMIRMYTPGRDQAPVITHTALAAPDIIAVTIEAQRIVPQTVTAYEPQPGDEKILVNWADGGVRYAKLKRGGKQIGILQGKGLDHLSTPERVEGDPFLEFLADDPANYAITSSDDPAYATAQRPLQVHRKTMPIDAQLPGGAFPTRHRLYLRMPTAISAGKTYTVRTGRLNVRNPDPQFTADWARLVSESIHVSQIGYRPSDPVKQATLSIWLGTGGAYRFADGMRFSVVDEATRKPVWSGRSELALDVDGTERLWTLPPQNFSRTAVCRLDFSAVRQPGTYRIYVDGVGSSLPFEIGEGVWEKAFLVQMKGLYNNRSGVEIGPPYSDFRKPRDFHPDDGAVVTRSGYDVMIKGQYSAGTKGIPAEDTREAVANAWGGYHDAGDWNPRRVSHMHTTLAQLELVELYPGYMNGLALNIPRTPGIPDIITEALFEIDCFRRMQLPDGGIPFGIESPIDPLAGEVSWLSTQHLYVLAPNMRDSWLYAAVAARAAKVLRPIDPALAQVYQDSAQRAYAWAEADYARRNADRSISTLLDLWMAVDARNLSSLVLYDLLGDKAYHDAFVASTCLTRPNEDICAWGVHMQSGAAFLYARLDDAKADRQLKQAALAAVVKLADDSLAYAAGNVFGVTQREKGRPIFAGFFSTSGGLELARAHYLTGKAAYLAGTIRSCQFQAGCNPNNLVYTTGLGSNPVRNPLHVDSRSTGQAAPAGLTVFGNVDYWSHRNSFWDINLRLVNKPEVIWPDAYAWPLTEAYFDVWMLVSANEFVIDTWAPNVFVWGYLASRQATP
ncbi:MAG: glycoside hydrolase family 9 protein [Planctomycetes bacterium]|nr:glycoside hydrolase family 9 protein [Planctomycetota bacterium]